MKANRTMVYDKERDGVMHDGVAVTMLAHEARALAGAIDHVVALIVDYEAQTKNHWPGDSNAYDVLYSFITELDTALKATCPADDDEPKKPEPEPGPVTETTDQMIDRLQRELTELRRAQTREREKKVADRVKDLNVDELETLFELLKEKGIC